MNNHVEALDSLTGRRRQPITNSCEGDVEHLARALAAQKHEFGVLQLVAFAHALDVRAVRVH